MYSIHTLWIGDRLPPVEELCLKSMIAFGHPVTLWSYGPISNVPQGVTTADATEVLPRSSIVSYRGRPRGVKLFANIFRCELLKRGVEIWLDADVLLLKPLDHDDDYIFGWESDRRINNAVLRIPADSQLMTQLHAFVFKRPVIPPWWPEWKKWAHLARAGVGWERGPEDISLGTFGPKALTHFVKQNGLVDLAKTVEVFYPVSYNEPHIYFETETVENRITDKTYAIHMWLTNVEPRIAAVGKEFFFSETFLGRMFKQYDVEIRLD